MSGCSVPIQFAIFSIGIVGLQYVQVEIFHLFSEVNEFNMRKRVENYIASARDPLKVLGKN